jgi:hypothetical protein
VVLPEVAEVFDEISFNEISLIKQLQLCTKAIPLLCKKETVAC